jgi:hypothetical protein
VRRNKPGGFSPDAGRVVAVISSALSGSLSGAEREGEERRGEERRGEERQE